MWEKLQVDKPLLEVQQHLLGQIESCWNSKMRQSVLCPTQNAINEVLVATAIRKNVPTLILCSDVSHYQNWQSAVAKFSANVELSDCISELDLDRPITPFTLSTYGFFCHSMNATQDQRALARSYWEYELASVGSWDQHQDNIGDFDAVKESGLMLDEQAICALSRYNDRLLRFIEAGEREVQDITSNWFNKYTSSIINSFREQGVGLIICEDSHDVTGIWAEVLNVLIRELGTRVLSCSPLRVNLKELSPRNFQLQTNMFDPQPLEVKLPLMVRDGCFKPYLGIFALATPSELEKSFLSTASSHLNKVLQRAEDSRYTRNKLSEFVKNELALLEKDVPGNWARRREFVESVLNYLIYFKHELPPVWKIFIEKLDVIDFHKNLPVIRDYVFRVLLASELKMENSLGEALLRAFQPLGYELTETRVEKGTSLIPNILSRSRAKEELLLKYLTKEFISLQRNLRAVIICDFIDSSSAEDIFPGNNFDSSSCGMISVQQQLESSSITLQLNPLVIYGDTIYFNEKFKTVLLREVEKHAEIHPEKPEVKLEEKNGYCSISIRNTRFHSFWVPLINMLMEYKLSHCIIVGREFLGPKWDGISFNSYFNLSSANSDLFGIRLLTRILMVDSDPVVTKHLWDFACILPEVELGMSDYQRLAERKAQGWHLCEDGEFEQGVSYFHPSLKIDMSEISDKIVEEVNNTAERLIDTRQYTYDKWMEREEQGDMQHLVLEVNVDPGLDPFQRFTACRKFKKKSSKKVPDKEIHVNFDSRDLVEALGNSVLSSLAYLDPQEEASELSISARSAGVYRIDVVGGTAEFSKRVRDAIFELLQPIQHQHYIVVLSCTDDVSDGILSRLFSRVNLDIEIPFGVPECFMKKKELGIFLRNWQRMVSNNPMKGHRLPDVKKEITEMLSEPKYQLRPSCRNCKLLL